MAEDSLDAFTILELCLLLLLEVNLRVPDKACGSGKGTPREGFEGGQSRIRWSKRDQKAGAREAQAGGERDKVQFRIRVRLRVITRSTML